MNRRELQSARRGIVALNFELTLLRSFGEFRVDNSGSRIPRQLLSLNYGAPVINLQRKFRSHPRESDRGRGVGHRQRNYRDVARLGDRGGVNRVGGEPLSQR